MRSDQRFRQLLRRDSYHVMCNRLTATENFGRYGGSCDSLVSVMNLVDVPDIDYVRDVGHVPNVGDVDYAQVVASVVIPREERFSRTQRKPNGESDVSDAYTDREASPADKRDQRRSIHWRHNIWSWEPTPSDADVNPSSVVKLTEAPRLIFHPRPSPRTNPCPMAEAIRNPIHHNARGIPNRAVFRDHLPCPIVVKVGIARNRSAHVLR